jgi:hypothetical protein
MPLIETDQQAHRLARGVKGAKLQSMKFRLIIIAAMLLAGCASQQPSGLSDTSKSQMNKNRDRDLYECERRPPSLALATSGRSSITA